MASAVGNASREGWVAHGFSRGGHEFSSNSCPPPLKRWATQSTVIHRISVDGALVPPNPYNIPMQPPRFYCPRLQIGEVQLADAETWHALQSLRLHNGDAITLFDGQGHLAQATLRIDDHSQVASPAAKKKERKHRRQAVATVATIDAVPAPTHTLTLLVSGCKGPRLSWLIEKCTELGVTRIWFTEFARSVVHLGPGHLQKLRRTAFEACKQCGRLWLPEIESGRELQSAITLSSDAALLIAQPADQATALGHWFQQNKATHHIIAVIGPEGGLTAEELELLHAVGGQLVRLGEHTLRIETATVAIAASWGAAAN